MAKITATEAFQAHFNSVPSTIGRYRDGAYAIALDGREVVVSKDYEKNQWAIRAYCNDGTMILAVGSSQKEALRTLLGVQ